MALMPAAIGMIHLITRPAWALRVSTGTLVAMLVIQAARHGIVDTPIFLRQVLASVASLIFWQLVTRFWRQWTLRLQDLGADMTGVLSQLEADRKEASEAAKRAALFDPSTGLPNRAGFVEALAQRLEPHGIEKLPAAGWVIALRIQAWTDSTANRGAATQELLLQALVVRLREVFGEDAVIGRSGVDTYLAWVHSLPGTAAEAQAALEEASKQLLPALTAGSNSTPTRPRLGLACSPDDGHDALTLISRAELACSISVRMDSATPTRYNESILADVQDRERLCLDIEQALQSGKFELHYQPLVPSRGDSLRKAEALIRWTHPTRGRVSPGTFIPLAEQSGLIIDLTDWVLQEATRQVKAWRATLHPEFQISVNMPPAYLMLCEREPGMMLQRLQALDIPANAVVLEITEGAMLEVTTELLQVLSLLRGLGFNVSLDDFGVGYSSFSQLDKLKLDFLKLDKSFVDDLGVKVERYAICDAIVMMAHELSFEVVAEGVETSKQRDLLIHMRVDYLQGYLFSKALPPSDFESWYRTHSSQAS
jgi:EAL domain-containing protein (putative c-di-GMP-specific phosphodiesterase class I)/GGDEF domain-containing protein